MLGWAKCVFYVLNYIIPYRLLSVSETCWSVILILLYNTNILTNKSLTPTNTFKLRWQDSAEKHVQVFTSNTPTCIAWLSMYCMSWGVYAESKPNIKPNQMFWFPNAWGSFVVMGNIMESYFFFPDTVGINSSRVKQCSVLCDADGLDSIYSSKNVSFSKHDFITLA